MPTENRPPVIWQPFERAAYRLDDTLSEEDRRAISTAHGRTLYQQRRPVPPLLQPLVDIARRSGASGRIVQVTIQAILAEMARLNMPCHCWTAERWQAMYQHRRLSGPLLTAFAFHLSDVPLPLQDERCRQPLCYARAVFGQDICQQEWQRLLAVLVNLGYSRRTQAVRVKVVVASVDSCGPCFPLRIQPHFFLPAPVSRCP